MLEKRFDSVDWADYFLENVLVQFDSVTLNVSNDEASCCYTIKCEEPIGFQLAGLWDECIIREIWTSAQGSFLSKCLDTVRDNYGQAPIRGGGTRSLSDQWLEVSVAFIDGSVLRVACKGYSID